MPLRLLTPPPTALRTLRIMLSVISIRKPGGFKTGAGILGTGPGLAGLGERLHVESTMPIPEFNDRGFLPAGVHDASLDEVLDRFGRFKGTGRREVLGERLAGFLEEARGTGLVDSVIVDGSFTTSKAEPGDIDLVVVLREGVSMETAFRPDQYNVVSARRVRARFGFDVLSAIQGGDALARAISFFAQVTGERGLSKGMVRVAI